jgi:hypothetical protein
MKLISRGLLALCLAFISLGASAQQHFTYSGVARVVKFRILPGKTADFYKYLSAVSKALEAEKAAGIIEAFDFLHSVDYVGPDKFDVILRIQYKNMAALDDLSDKTEPVLSKAYGTPENRAAMGKLGNDSAEVVSAELVRTIHLLP